MEPLISIRGLVNRFGNQPVHDGLDLDIFPGEILGIVGGSGSGKTVLLRSIIGLQRPHAGVIRVTGHDVTRMSTRQMRVMRRRWGVAFQSSALFSSLTVAENIQLPIRECVKLPERLLRELAELRLRMVGLPLEALDKYPSELSGGMKKRAALARALALDPVLLFLDEPTAGLDPIGAANIDDLVLYLRNNLNLTIVMITHDLDSLYATCDRVAVLVDRALVVDRLENLLQHPHPWIHEYFHGPRARHLAGDGGRAIGAELTDPPTDPPAGHDG